MAGNYKRKEGKIQTKKIQRKIKLRTRHVIISFFLLVGLFFTIQQVYLFAIEWDKLDIQNVHVICKNQEIKDSIQRNLAGVQFGNILLLDTKALREKMTTHPRVKDVHIRKIFPLSLNITIEERKPFAVLKKKQWLLVDNTAFIIGKTNGTSDILPLLIDRGNFQEYFPEKIRIAWLCLESLAPAEREQIEVMDLSEFMNIKVKLRGHITWLILGRDNYAERIHKFLSEKINLESYGALEYVDLRFQDRFFIKPLHEYPQKDAPTLDKEDN